MNLGENIYRLRTEKNMSQGDLANALEVSRQSVSKWENDSAVPELEKLIKMAQIFGITIDELVTGEANAHPVPPPPQSIPAVPAKENRLSTAQILGIVLLAFGGLCLIVFTVVGIFTGIWMLGLTIALPFLLCGTVCLVCRRNIGLKCAWCVYIPLWILGMVVMVNSMGGFNAGTIFQILLLLAGIALTATTLWRMKTGRINLPRWAKVLLSAAMIVGLIITLLGMLPPMQADVDGIVTTEDTVIITPADPSKTPTASP